MKNIVRDWLVSAEGDLLLIQEIVTMENLTHLSAFHDIDSRYPGEMGLLPDGKPTVAESTGFFNVAQAIHKATKSICISGTKPAGATPKTPPEENSKSM